MNSLLWALTALSLWMRKWLGVSVSWSGASGGEDSETNSEFVDKNQRTESVTMDTDSELEWSLFSELKTLISGSTNSEMYYVFLATICHCSMRLWPQRLEHVPAWWTSNTVSLRSSETSFDHAQTHFHKHVLIKIKATQISINYHFKCKSRFYTSFIQNAHDQHVNVQHSSLICLIHLFLYL